MNIIDSLSSFVTCQVMMVKALLKIIPLEAKLAKLSIMPLILNLFLILVTMATLWLSGMGVIGYVLAVYFDHVLWGLGGILLLNLFCLFILLKYLRYNFRQMSFSKTRQLLASQYNQSENHELKRQAQ